MKEMLCEARKAKKAVGAFNITNYETAAAVLKAAEAENEPVIIQLYMRLFDTRKAYDLCGTLQRLAYRGKVPVALHLDHGSTVKQAKDALAWGYTSVMYDGSELVCNEIEIVEGALAEGDEIYSYEIIGSQTLPGQSPNVIEISSIVIVNKVSGEDVTSNYLLSVEDGSLTVYVED